MAPYTFHSISSHSLHSLLLLFPSLMALIWRCHVATSLLCVKHRYIYSLLIDKDLSKCRNTCCRVLFWFICAFHSKTSSFFRQEFSVFIHRPVYMLCITMKIIVFAWFINHFVQIRNLRDCFWSGRACRLNMRCLVWFRIL